MFDRREFNRKNIEEFRARGGKIGGRFEGSPMLLLTTTGAKTGRRHTTPLMYLPDGDRFIVFASKAGGPNNPDWYHNLVATSKVTVEVGTETFDAEAVVTSGDERDSLYARQASLYPQFADYQMKTARKIPVIALERLV